MFTVGCFIFCVGTHDDINFVELLTILQSLYHHEYQQTTNKAMRCQLSLINSDINNYCMNAMSEWINLFTVN